MEELRDTRALLRGAGAGRSNRDVLGGACIREGPYQKMPGRFSGRRVVTGHDDELVTRREAEDGTRGRGGRPLVGMRR